MGQAVAEVVETVGCLLGRKLLGGGFIVAGSIESTAFPVRSFEKRCRFVEAFRQIGLLAALIRCLPKALPFESLALLGQQAHAQKQNQKRTASIQPEGEGNQRQYQPVAFILPQVKVQAAVLLGIVRFRKALL